MDPEEIKMVNCANCGRELLGESMRCYVLTMSEHRRKALPPMVLCRMNGRPYCGPCARPKNHNKESKGRKPDKRIVDQIDSTPWQDNVIRQLEDG